MSNQFSSGKHAIGVCDRCGWTYKLFELRPEVQQFTQKNILVCDPCWDPVQPQTLLGFYPIEDPQAVRNPRPDVNQYPESRELWIESTVTEVFFVFRVGRGTLS